MQLRAPDEKNRDLIQVKHLTNATSQTFNNYNFIKKVKKDITSRHYKFHLIVLSFKSWNEIHFAAKL